MKMIARLWLLATLAAMSATSCKTHRSSTFGANSSVVVQYPITVLTQAFTQPAVSASATANVGSSQWMVPGQNIIVQGLGVLQVQSIPGPTSAVIENIGVSSNAAPGAVGAINAGVGVSGPAGPGATSTAWSVPAWYIDPANVTTCASDTNDGQSATCGGAGVGPLRTLAQVSSRWGTYSPTLAQATVITGISSLPPSDFYRYAPYFVGAGSLTWQGTFQSAATTTIGTFTAPNYTAGSLGTITAAAPDGGLQAGNYWSTACAGTCVGKYVKDTTAGAYFHIVADLGSATASIDQPMVPLSFGTYATIANGDSLSVGAWTTFYADSFPFTGSGGGGLVIQQATVNTDSFFVVPKTGFGTFYETTWPQAMLTDTNGPVPFFIGNYFAGAFSGSGGFIGGTLAAVGNQFNGQCSFDGDVVVLNRFHMQANNGPNFFSRMYIGAAPDVDIVPAFWQAEFSQYGSQRMWGPAGWNLAGGTTISIEPPIGTFAGIMLLTGGLQVDSSSSAFPWVAASHSYGAAVTVTPANVDTNGSLRNPATGSGLYIQ